MIRSLNLSQKQLAMEAGMLQGRYSRIENGKVESTLVKLAGALEVSLAELVKQNGDLQVELNLPLMKKVKAGRNSAKTSMRLN